MENKYNGFTISLNIGCLDPDNQKLVELENAISKVIEDSNCILLSGKGEYREFKTVKNINKGE